MLHNEERRVEAALADVALYVILLWRFDYVQCIEWIPALWKREECELKSVEEFPQWVRVFNLNERKDLDRLQCIKDQPEAWR